MARTKTSVSIDTSLWREVRVACAKRDLDKSEALELGLQLWLQSLKGPSALSDDSYAVVNNRTTLDSDAPPQQNRNPRTFTGTKVLELIERYGVGAVERIATAILSLEDSAGNADKQEGRADPDEVYGALEGVNTIYDEGETEARRKVPRRVKSSG